MLGVLQFGGLTATLFTFGAAPTAAQAAILFQTSIILVVIVSSVALGEGYLRRRIVGATFIALGVGLGISG
jgi:drug/metabolite transporter (DMT)-like permease